MTTRYKLVIYLFKNRKVVTLIGSLSHMSFFTSRAIFIHITVYSMKGSKQWLLYESTKVLHLYYVVKVKFVML